MIRTRLAKTVAAIVFAVVFMGIGAGIALAAQNHMINARNYLNSAIAELDAAVPDKGGHRNNALQLAKQAVGQVNAGINFAAH